MDSSSASSVADLTPLVEPFAWTALLRRDQMLARGYRWKYPQGNLIDDLPADGSEGGTSDTAGCFPEALDFFAAFVIGVGSAFSAGVGGAGASVEVDAGATIGVACLGSGARAG